MRPRRRGHDRNDRNIECLNGLRESLGWTHYVAAPREAGGWAESNDVTRSASSRELITV